MGHSRVLALEGLIPTPSRTPLGRQLRGIAFVINGVRFLRIQKQQMRNLVFCTAVRKLGWRSAVAERRERTNQERWRLET